MIWVCQPLSTAHHMIFSQSWGRAENLKRRSKVIVALLVALELFVDGAYDNDVLHMRRYLEYVAAGLVGFPVDCLITTPAESQLPPLLEITVKSELGRSAFEVCRRLRQGSPPVYVGHGSLDAGKLIIHPLHLNESRTEELLRRLREELAL